MSDFYEFDYPMLNSAHRYTSTETGSYALPGRGRMYYKYKDGSERTGNFVRPTNYYAGSASSAGSSSERNKVEYLDDLGQRVIKTTVGSRTSIEDGRIIWTYNPHVDVTPYSKFATKRTVNDLFDGIENRLLDKIDNQTYDLGAILAESAETSKYIASRGLQVAKFATSLLSGNIPGALRAVGLSPNKIRRRIRRANREGRGMHAASSLSAAWLEYNFAIRPLVGDIGIATELFQDPTEVLRKINLTVTASQKVSHSKEYSNIKYGPKDRLNYVVQANRRMSVTYSIVDADQVADKALGLNAPTASAWELVPFSWVIDYVVNVGDFLRLSNATDGLAFSHGYISTKVTQKARYSYSRTSTAEQNNKRYRNTFRHRYSGNVSFYERDPIYSFPTPSIVVDPGVSLRQASYLASLSTLLVHSYRTNKLNRG
jgi:hypothetical protein